MKNETLTAILNEKDKLSAYMGVGVDYYKGETGKSGADEVYIGAEPPTDPQVKLWVDTEDQSLDVVNWDDVENKPNFATVATSGSYNDLTDKPVIPEAPDLTGYATESWVEGKGYTTMTEVEAKGYLTEHQDLSTYALKSEIPSLTGYAKTADLSTVATSGSYNDLIDKPTIPEAPDLTNYATKDDLANAKPDLTPYAKTADLSTVATSGSYEDLTNKPDLFDGDYNNLTNKPNLFSGNYEDLTNKPTIPEPYTLPTASTTTLGGVKVDGSTITIADGVISSVGGGLIGKKMKGYNQPESEWTWIADWAQHPEKYYVLIEGVSNASKECPVIRTQASNNHFYYYWFEDDTLHERYINFTDNTLSQVESVSQYADGGTVWLTEENRWAYIPDGGSEPDAYLKSASVSGNTLTLTNKDNTTVVFTPTGGSGGGSGGVSGYAFSSTQTFTDVDKAHLKEIHTNKNTYMTIDNLTVVRIMSFGVKRGFVVINTNGATSNQVLVYTVDIDGSGNVTSNTFTLFMSYYLAGNSSALSGDIITSENWNQYISGGSGGDWLGTSSLNDSNLYNAKEMVLYWIDNYQNKHQTYLNFIANFNFNTGLTLGTGWLYTDIYLDADDSISHPSIQYDGSSISANNCIIYFILYKT